MVEDVQGIVKGKSVTFEKTITSEDIAKFTEISGDTNPLHSDAEYAVRTRFNEPIAHGILAAGVISAALGTRLAPDSVVIYLKQNLSFRAPVKPGDVLTATVEAMDVDVERSTVTLSTIVTNQDDTTVIQGDALVLVDPLG